VPYNNCYMAVKSQNEIKLHKAVGIKNVFVNDWKKSFTSDPKKKIASVPFLRNLIEYTHGEADPKYIKLTSLLHWKSDTGAITVDDLDQVYNQLCQPAVKSPNPQR